MPLSASSELDRLSVVLVSTRNPLNIGAAARAMNNFGFSRLRVVNAYQLAFREARSAVGASEVLRTAEQFHSLAEAVADCQLVIGTTAARNRHLRQPLRALPRLLEPSEGGWGPPGSLSYSARRSVASPIRT